jgi:hypothetical protein
MPQFGMHLQIMDNLKIKLYPDGKTGPRQLRAGEGARQVTTMFEAGFWFRLSQRVQVVFGLKQLSVSALS